MLCHFACELHCAKGRPEVALLATAAASFAKGGPVETQKRGMVSIAFTEGVGMKTGSLVAESYY